MCTELGICLIVPTPLQVSIQEKLPAQLLDQLPRFPLRSLLVRIVTKWSVCGQDVWASIHILANDTESVGGDDLTDTHGYPTKGAHHGYAEQIDHWRSVRFLGATIQARMVGMLWSGTVERGFRVCRAALEWAPHQWAALQRTPHERDTLEWAPLQWHHHEWRPPEWGAHQWDHLEWNASHGPCQ